LVFAIISVGARSDTVSALTTVPTKMNFQGRLTSPSGTVVADGVYNMKFRIYDAATAGTLLWSETRDVNAGTGVTISNGVFSVKLGSVTSLPASMFTNANLYFEIELPTPASATCATSSCAVWTEGAMTPRNQLATSAYAFNSDTLDGLDSTAFVQLDANNSYTGTAAYHPTSDSANLFTISNAASQSMFKVDSTNDQITIGTVDAAGTTFILDSKTTTGDPVGVDGAMYYNAALDSFRCYQDGEWRACVGGLVKSSTAAQTITNTAVETAFTTNYTIPANNCIPGRVYRVIARGTYTTTTTAPTLNVRVKAGTVILATTGALATSASAANRQWTLQADVVCQTAGVSGTVEAAGVFTRATSAILAASWEMRNTAPITLNTTVAQTLTVTTQFNTANAANTIRVSEMTIESLGP
jgi:hypothetical protein